jgi:hypothetical protein
MQIPAAEGILNLSITICLAAGVIAALAWTWERRTRLLGVSALALFLALTWAHQLLLNLIYLHALSPWMVVVGIAAVSCALATGWELRKVLNVDGDILYDRPFRKKFGIIFSLAFWGIILVNIVRNFLQN